MKKTKHKKKCIKNRNIRKTTNIKPNKTHTHNTNTHAHTDKDETLHRRPCIKNRQDNIILSGVLKTEVGWCCWIVAQVHSRPEKINKN